MVQHYLHGMLTPVPAVADACAKCGSRCTEIFGRSNDGGTIGIHCHHCGTRSDVPTDDDRSGAPGDMAAELEALVAIGKTLTRLQNADARRRILCWAVDRFTAPVSNPVATPRAQEPADQTLMIDGVGDLFATPRRADLRLVVVNDSTGDELDDLFEQPDTPSTADDDRYHPDDTRDLQDRRPLQEPPASAGREPELDVLVADFVSDFRRLAREWQNP